MFAAGNSMCILDVLCSIHGKYGQHVHYVYASTNYLSLYAYAQENVVHTLDLDCRKY